MEKIFNGKMQMTPIVDVGAFRKPIIDGTFRKSLL